MSIMWQAQRRTCWRVCLMVNEYACEWCNTDYGVFSSNWRVIDDTGIEWFMCNPCQLRWKKHGLHLERLYG